MLKTVKKTTKKYLVPTMIIALVGTSFVFGQSIQNLTSNEQAKKIENEVTDAATAPRIPGNSGQHPHSIGIGLGQTFLNSDFGDFGGDQITWDLYYTYAASHSFDFMANFHISSHDLKLNNTKLAGLAMGVKAKVLQFDAFSPFIIGGLGFYQPRLTRTINNQLVESESKLVFGFNLGAGADLRLNDRFSIGVAGHLHNPFDVKQENGSEDVEGSYFKLIITGFYHF
jgi:opacity protein-like surface antigen